MIKALNNSSIIRIIRYTPFILILIFSIITTFILYKDYSKSLETNRTIFSKSLINKNKEKLQTRVFTIIDYIEQEVRETDNLLKSKLKEEIKTAHKMMLSVYEQYKNKKTRDEIIEIINTVLRDVRFNDGRGYFLIISHDGTSIMHPLFPEEEGLNISARKDVRGKTPFKLLKTAVLENNGFTSFHFFHALDKTIQREKIVYGEYFKPFDLIIATGEYLDEFENALKSKILKDIQKINYGNKEHPFLYDKEGNILVSFNNGQVNGKNIFKIKNIENLTTKLRKFMSSNESSKFIQYSLIVDENKKHLKLSYFKKSPLFNWMIATGINIDQMNKIVLEKEKELQSQYKNDLNTLIIYISIGTLFLLFISHYISKVIEKRFIKYQENLEDQIKENKTQKETLLKAQRIAKIGEYELDLNTKIAFWSDSMIKLFGVEGSKEMPGPEFLKKIMYEEDWSYFESSLHRCMKHKVEHLCRYRIKRPLDKKTVWIECRGELNEENNLIGTVQDITQSKLLEIENHRKEELLYQQSKMAAMGEMLGNIAHQWRQPLSAISTASTGTKIQKEMNCLSDEQLNSALTVINESAQHLSSTIDDFRNFFNPNNKSIEFDISNTISKTLKLIDAQFTAKDIKIIQNIEEYKLVSIENELIQVLINILNNARDALLLKENQQRLIFINIYKKDDISYIEILDNAGGIEEKIIDRIFEPYFTTKHKSQGTGIGLYMSEEIIRMHLNGNVLVSNETYNYEGIEYTGAKFIIEITD